MHCTFPMESMGSSLIQILTCVLLFHGAMAYAIDRTIEFKPTRATDCAELLTSIDEALTPHLPEMTVGEPIVLHTGVFKELRKLALGSGMPRSTAIRAVVLVERALEENKNRDNVLGAAYKFLLQYQSDPHTLIICVFEGTCHMNMGTVFIPDESITEMGRFGHPQTQIPLDKPIPNLILMNGGATPYAWQNLPGPPAAVALGWAIDFLSAAVSFADYKLVTEWIDANVRLLKAQERSDELFDRYARVIPKPKVDYGFYRAFTASHAAAAALAVYPGGADLQRELAMFEITAAQGEMDHVIRHFNLSLDNIVEFGHRITREMNATILRAKDL